MLLNSQCQEMVHTPCYIKDDTNKEGVRRIAPCWKIGLVVTETWSRVDVMGVGGCNVIRTAEHVSYQVKTIH